MDCGKNLPPVDKWCQRFGNTEDKTLYVSTRNECLALFTQNEIMSRGLMSGDDESPRKKVFMERAGMVN
jgi:hypothetical protein